MGAIACENEPSNLTMPQPISYPHDRFHPHVAPTDTYFTLFQSDLFQESQLHVREHFSEVNGTEEDSAESIVKVLMTMEMAV